MLSAIRWPPVVLPRAVAATTIPLKKSSTALVIVQGPVISPSTNMVHSAAAQTAHMWGTFGHTAVNSLTIAKVIAVAPATVPKLASVSIKSHPFPAPSQYMGSIRDGDSNRNFSPRGDLKTMSTGSGSFKLSDCHAINAEGLCLAPPNASINCFLSGAILMKSYSPSMDGHDSLKRRRIHSCADTSPTRPTGTRKGGWAFSVMFAITRATSTGSSAIVRW